MSTKSSHFTNLRGWVALLLLALPGAVSAQFTYTTSNNQITITGYTGPGGAVDIPATINGLPVKAIGTRAFLGKSSLTSATLPDSVTTIGNYAFQYCNSLASVTLGSSVASIGNETFYYCPNLTHIGVNAGNPYFGSLDGILFNQAKTTLILCPQGKAGVYVIPGSVTTIGAAAFQSCTSLASVTIPDGVTTIGNYAFFRNTNLTGITLGNGVATIGEFAFQNCPGLTNVTIPDRVTSIGNYAFHNCTGLTNVTIGASVVSLGWRVFEFCSSLTSVYFKGNAPTLDTPTLFHGAGIAIVYYLPGTLGWGTMLAERPTMPWYQPSPRILTVPGLGIHPAGFGFVISWATNANVVVEATSDPSSSNWTAISTNTLSNGSHPFNDPDWTDYPDRFYRLRSP